MEKSFLNDYTQKMKEKNITLGVDQDQIKPWYNTHGDCIEFQTRQEAIIGERVDNYLTIYRSAVDNEPIGFQIKDVIALIRKKGLKGLAYQAEFENTVILSVRILLLAAFEDSASTIAHREGYGLALEVTPSSKVEVQIPIFTALSH